MASLEPELDFHFDDVMQDDTSLKSQEQDNHRSKSKKASNSSKKEKHRSKHKSKHSKNAHSKDKHSKHSSHSKSKHSKHAKKDELSVDSEALSPAFSTRSRSRSKIDSLNASSNSDAASQPKASSPILPELQLKRQNLSLLSLYQAASKAAPQSPPARAPISCKMDNTKFVNFLNALEGCGNCVSPRKNATAIKAKGLPVVSRMRTHSWGDGSVDYQYESCGFNAAITRFRLSPSNDPADIHGFVCRVLNNQDAVDEHVAPIELNKHFKMINDEFYFARDVKQKKFETGMGSEEQALLYDPSQSQKSPSRSPSELAKTNSGFETILMPMQLGPDGSSSNGSSSSNDKSSSNTGPRTPSPIPPELQFRRKTPSTFLKTSEFVLADLQSQAEQEKLRKKKIQEEEARKKQLSEPGKGPLLFTPFVLAFPFPTQAQQHMQASQHTAKHNTGPTKTIGEKRSGADPNLESNRKAAERDQTAKKPRTKR